VALVAAGVAALHELGATQPAAYLEPGIGPSRSLALSLGAVASVAGALGERLLPGAPRDRLGVLLASASLVTTSSAWALHLAFGSTRVFDVVALGVPALGGFALGAALSASARALGRTLLALGAVGRALDPFRLGAVALVLLGGAALSAVVGLLRSAAAIGLLLATLAAWSSTLVVFLERRPLARPRRTRAAVGGALAVGFAGLLGAEALVPTSDLAHHANPVVFSQRSERASYVVTAGQSAFELFVDGRLALSSIDQARYHEALVHPAMLMAPRRERVLVIGAGHGAAAREVLRHADVRELWLVVPDRALVDLAKTSAWLSRLARGALDDARLRVVEAEAISWLSEPGPVFDVAIVDLPDPGGYVEGKNYTRHFYRLLAARTSAQGVAVVQATSPFGSPVTFANVEATLRAAGLETRAYRAPVPTFGDWGFVLCSRAPLAPPPGELGAWLSGTTLAESFTLPADFAPGRRAEVATLPRQTVVEAFALEREQLGL
jgi:spermidine synthase